MLYICRSEIDGVKAIYNKIQLSPCENRAVTYSKDDGNMPIACTLALWGIDTGKLNVISEN